MKKFVSLLLAVVMVLSCVFLPGCGEEQGEGQKEGQDLHEISFHISGSLLSF